MAVVASAATVVGVMVAVGLAREKVVVEMVTVVAETGEELVEEVVVPDWAEGSVASVAEAVGLEASTAAVKVVASKVVDVALEMVAGPVAAEV